MFPKIHHITDLTNKIGQYPDFSTLETPIGVKIICYDKWNTTKDTFTGENSDFRQECRGITFNKSGDVVARPLHKFFNIGEKESTQPNVIPWDKITRISTKYDGSMITPFLLEGQLYCKTKRGYENDESQSALAWLKNNPTHLNTILYWLNAGYTPICEWVNPMKPIVLSYNKPEMILLQLRNMHTGEYIDFENPELMKFTYPFKLAENNICDFVDENGVVSWDKLIEAANTRTGVEGWILQTPDGDMWKVKTEWYLSLHRTCTFLRWRDLLRACYEDALDDLRSSFSRSGRDIGVLDFVENYVNNMVDTRVSETVELAGVISTHKTFLDARNIFIKFGKERYFREATRYNRQHEITISDLRRIIREKFFKEEIPLWGLGVVSPDFLHDWENNKHRALEHARGVNDHNC